MTTARERGTNDLNVVAREQIRQWMIGADLTQEDIAAYLRSRGWTSIRQTWVSRYLLGKVGADLNVLAAIADMFGHTIGTMFDLPPHPIEREILSLGRAMTEEACALWIRVGREMTRERRVRRSPKKRGGLR